MVLVAPATFAGPVIGSAYAQPGDVGDAGDQAPIAPAPNEGGVTLPWPALGLPSTIELYGDSTASYTVPLPAGLSATRLQGMIHTPSNIAAGYLEIDDGDGKFLAAVDLPPAAPGLVRTPFDVDISAARIRPSSVRLSFTVHASDSGDRVCGPAQRLTLSDLATVYAGTQLPVTTIANFFPPVLERVTIYTPTDANPAEQQAALTLVSTLARLYAPRPLPIAVVSQQRGTVPPPAFGLDRAVVVEKGRPGLTVENAGMPNAYLRVSGEGDALSTQVSLLVNRLQPLAQAPTARVDQAEAATALSGDTLTFSQLEVSEKNTTFLRSTTVDVGFDRATLGPRFDKLHVHLLADYTPVPADDAAAVVIRSQNVVVYQAPLDGSGHLDATFDLEHQLVDRQWISLDLALTYTPNQDCGPLVASMAFQIDPRSTLTMHRGGPPLEGFAAFPSEFSPSFMVALDGSSPDQLSYAARVLTAIARQTQVEIKPQVVNIQAAADANSGALIVANSKTIKQTSLTPPVSGDGSIINFGLPAELNVNIEYGLGSIQAFADPPRNRSVVLVTTTGDWTLVDPLFSYIDGTTSDWSELTGDVLAAGAEGVPVNVAIRPAGDIFVPTPSTSAWHSWVAAYVAGGAVLVAVAVLAVGLYLRRRRIRRTRKLVGAHSAGDSYPQ
ncbi:hypothetical protein BST36_24705 [Mycolicibacterium moriokaense]|nr:hypothetical protein [Mycolicibacterium moriokaense]ORB17643.1 hypothetical protein BST36_24705 [Mycolicibacterium moriokaense]